MSLVITFTKINNVDVEKFSIGFNECYLVKLIRIIQMANRGIPLEVIYAFVNVLQTKTKKLKYKNLLE